MPKSRPEPGEWALSPSTLYELINKIESLDLRHHYRSGRLMVWQAVAGCAAFVAANFFLWTLDLSDQDLLLAATPLSVVYFPCVIWLYARKPKVKRSS